MGSCDWCVDNDCTPTPWPQRKQVGSLPPHPLPLLPTCVIKINPSRTHTLPLTPPLLHTAAWYAAVAAVAKVCSNRKVCSRFSLPLPLPPLRATARHSPPAAMPFAGTPPRRVQQRPVRLGPVRNGSSHPSVLSSRRAAPRHLTPRHAMPYYTTPRHVGRRFRCEEEN